MNNLELYEKVRSVPDGAKKEIAAGRLKGMTDINPMWRIKTLTEQFGVCGIGWKPEIVRTWLDNGANGEIIANVEIKLYVKVEDQWSEGIPGVGGSKFVSKEKNGDYTDDECYKKAYTDALSVACKALGIGADVYWNKDESKYTPKKVEAEPSSITRNDFKNKLSDLGINDVDKTVQWFEEKYGKPFEDFSNEDVSDCIAWAQGRVERKKREAGNA